jgi:hypothetical protein
VLDRLFGGQFMAPQQHLPPQRGAVEHARGEQRHGGHRNLSSFENVRTPSTGALGIYTSDTWVNVALVIASASSSMLRC